MQETIRVNGRPVGIIGLGAAIRRLSDRQGKDSISTRKAAEILFSEIADRNYIPAGAEDAYLKGLENAWARAHGLEETDTHNNSISIRILGPGCVSCNMLDKMVRKVLEKERIAADIEHVRELDSIWRYGVMQTPALVINEKVMCSGRLPTMAKIEEWIRQAT